MLSKILLKTCIYSKPFKPSSILYEWKKSLLAESSMGTFIKNCRWDTSSFEVNGWTWDVYFFQVLKSGIVEEKFLSWLRSGPTLLQWLPTCYRLSATEMVSHRVRCRVCKTFPITGLRYVSNYYSLQYPRRKFLLLVAYSAGFNDYIKQ